jgi:hypothetical protein
MIICMFCGAQDPVHYKQVSNKFVLHIVQRQRDAGICEPIVNFISSQFATDSHEMQQCTAAGEEYKSEADDAESVSVDDDDVDANVHSCMCCFYWVARRNKQLLVPLPMQNLLWYVRTLKGCESNKCDSRILLRLVKTVTEPGNMYARFFHASEMEGMSAIKNLSISSRETTTPIQGQRSFCVKKQIAQLWHSNNGESMLVAHAHAADLLR